MAPDSAIFRANADEENAMTKKSKLPKHLDAGLPIEERVNFLVSQLTLREKIAQMLHGAPPVPRLQIPAYNWWNECLHGVARAGRATVFPQAIGMAASFDVPLMGKVATAISDEARAKHHDALRLDNHGIYFGLTYWSPNINIFRDPRWGRGQETYGEDPYLTARMGVAFVKGLQGNDRKYLKLVATAKHYAVHSGPESLRHSFDAVVSKRDMWETYLPAFRALVQEGKVYSVMGAYNRTNGEPCCGSPTLLQKILREQWGFEGYVVSDCWALKDFHEGHKVTKTPQETVAMALRNGCDVNCGNLYSELVKAVEEGLVTEADVDRAFRRLFTARMKLGMFDPPAKVPFSKIKSSVVGCAKHRQLSLQMARESMVLLENRNQALPLRNNVRTLGVIGPNAMDMTVLLGNYNGFAPAMASVVEGVLGKVSSGTQVLIGRGCELTGDQKMWFGECNPNAMKDCDAVVAVVGYTAEIEGEEGCVPGAEGDRSAYGLPGRQMELLQKVRESARKMIVVVMAGSPVDLTWIKANADAVIFAWYPGEAGGLAVADVLFGDYNPAGRLPITFPTLYEQLPPFTEYAMKGRTYRFMDQAPLYRFGYGLSYSTFKYGKIRLSKRSIKAGETVTASIEVRNAGKVAGDEVVQLYVSDVRASVPTPRLHLEGFARVNLKAGQKKVITFELSPDQLAAYDDEGKPFVEPGEFRISIGGGQPDDPAAGAVSAVLTVAG
jgi:beta-glucosidase